MNRFFLLILLCTALLLAACEGGTMTGDGNTGSTENGNTATDTAEDPSAEIVELENKAYEAWKAKDGKFFEGMIADNFHSAGSPSTDKAALVKSISESPCEVKEFKINDPKTVKLTDEAMLITHKVTADYDCDGRQGVSPMYAASVYIKTADGWKGAYHQNVPAADATGEPNFAPAGEVKSAEDEMTKALAERENQAWKAWSEKNGQWFEENMTAGAVSVNPGGIEEKAAIVKSISEMNCDIKSYSTDGFKSVKLTDDVMLLSYIGKQDAKCGDTELPKQVFATTIFVKEGDAWKGAFHMETPTA